MGPSAHRFSRPLRYGTLLLALTGGFIACATSSGHSANSGVPTEAGGGGGDDGSSQSSSSSGTGSGSSSGDMMFAMHEAGMDAGDDGDAEAGHMTVCRGDSGEAGCTCINIASIGHEGVWGPCSSDTTTAFQAWLNTQSTAHVDTYDQTKPLITPEFLSQYDVIILQWMVDPQNAMQTQTGCPAPCLKNNEGSPWSFSAAEISALQTWVENGGGIIALDGFQGTSPSAVVDITSTNQLLSFTDMQFNKDVNLSNGNLTNEYCWGGADVYGGPIASSPGTTPTYGTWSQAAGSIGLHVSDIGALDTRSIDVKSTSNVVVDEQWTDTSGTHVAAAHETIGKGHVFFYGDEWLTYTGEWTGAASCQTNPTMYTDPNNPCYGNSAAEVFQIPQFWYNAIKYAASSVTCFTISVTPSQMDAGERIVY